MLPDRQDTCPYPGCNLIVLEVLAIVTRRTCIDLGTGADHVDPENGSDLQLGFCGWDAGVVPAIGDETVRDELHGPVLLVLVCDEVGVPVEDGAAVIAAVVEWREGELDTV